MDLSENGNQSDESPDMDEIETINLINKIKEGIKFNKNFHIYSIDYYFKKDDEKYIDNIIQELNKLGYDDITRDSSDGEHLIIKW